MKYFCDDCAAGIEAPTDTDTVRCPGCGQHANKVTTPATELRQAAALLRDKATAATHEGRTRWATGHTLGSRSPVVLDDPEQPSVLIETYAARLEVVNRYLALLGPATGLALARWLDSAADDAVQIGASPQALAVAQELLGITTTPHVCDNCASIDPQNCLTNPTRTEEPNR